MENVIPTYTRPIANSNDPVNSASYWDEAIELFDQKQYKKTIINVLLYMNSNLLDNVNTENDFEVVKMQGSAQIHVKVTDTTFSVKAPFLRITNKTNEIALLRKIAEVNFTPLRLAQIRKKEDVLSFEYQMPIELSQPNKVYDILRTVIVYADLYDDLFIDKYNAEFYKEPQIKQLTNSEQETVWKQISQILKEYEDYQQFFKDKRWDDWIWDIIVITLLKISNMPYVNGKLRTDLIKNINIMFDGDVNYNHRMEKGKNYLNTLLKQSKEEIMSNIYHSEQFLSLRWRSSPQIITDKLENSIKRVAEYEKDESYFNLSYYLQYILLKLIYDYNLDQTYTNKIETVLEEVSGLEPDVAALKLAKTFYELHSGSVNKQETIKKKKGFFSNLFN